jgi:hypothetical protein
MAAAKEAGMRAASRPSAGTRPSATIIRQDDRKTPVTTGQEKCCVVAASRAAPGVGQASTIGMRRRHDSMAPAAAMPKHAEASD